MRLRLGARGATFGASLAGALLVGGCGSRSGLFGDYASLQGDGGALQETGDDGGSEDDDAGPIDEAGAEDGNGCVGSPADPLNCGACGENCQGGACIEGVCQPVVLESDPLFLAVDAENLYLNLGTSIAKCPLGDSCTQVTPLATRCDILRECHGLASAGTHVAFAQQSTPSSICTMNVASIATDGGTPPAPLGLADCGGVVALDDSNVYWPYSGSLLQCATSGCGSKPLTLASGQTITSVAVDATCVYWGGGSTVSAVPIGGGEVVTLASGQHDVTGIAVDAANVYWANLGDSTGKGGIFQAPLHGGSPITLLSVPWTQFAGSIITRLIAVDATYVYWGGTLDAPGGIPTLSSIPVGGGATAFAELAAPFAVAATSVYGMALQAIVPCFDDAGCAESSVELAKLAKPLRGQQVYEQPP